MSSKIYKYMGSDVLKLALSEQGECSFKCSYPRDFNDPYELFLTINFQQEPELLAYYQEIIGEMPQLPVTCFSKAPNVIPMWAHYGHNHRGIVVEFDETEFLKNYPKARFNNVDYQDEPNSNLEDMLNRAFHIGKPRYHFFLQQGVFSTAYFTKQLCWNYEQERRLVVNEEDIIEVDNIQLLKFPTSCISALIVGSKVTDETKEFAIEAAKNIGALYYEMKIGKSSTIPFFIDAEDEVCVFSEEGIVKANKVCQSCKEPIAEGNEICTWCSINDEHIQNAAKRNPLRIMSAAGILDKWYKSMLDVGKK
jgi:hypothetical protein